MDPKSNTKLAKLKKDLGKASGKAKNRPSRTRKTRKWGHKAARNEISKEEYSPSFIHETYAGQQGTLDFRRVSSADEAILASRAKHRAQRRQRWRAIGLGQGPGVTIPRQVVEDLVRASAWWYGHPMGPTTAPSHYRRIYLSPGSSDDWRINFGANTFLIGDAVRECRNFLRRQKISGDSIEEVVMERTLMLLVRSNVANYCGDVYVDYPMENGFMHFGTQAIHVGDFVSLIVKNLRNV